MKSKKLPPEPEPVPEAPAGLSERSRALWSQLVPRRARSPERLLLLSQALQALDQADAARAVLTVEGLTVKSERSGVVHAHPLVRIEADARRAWERMWRELSLGWDGMIDGKISSWP